MLTTRDTIYLDYNATTPVRPEALGAMTATLELAGNPSSVHSAGRSARSVLEHARRQVAGAVAAAPANIVFTSGGSEANVTALHRTGACRLIVSAVEHESVARAAEVSGLPVDVIPVGSNGVIDLGALEDLLDGDAEGTLVAVMLANNETGAIQPVKDAARLAHDAGARLHCDAIQALGKIPVDAGVLDADTMSVAAHKLGGPKGAGALIVRGGINLDPLIVGGGQEQKRRSGTENLPGAAGFGAAAERSVAELEGFAGLGTWRDAFEARLLAEIPEALVVSADAPRLPNTSNVAIPGLPSEMQLMALDIEGVCVSTGSACSSGKVARSEVLTAMGYDDSIAGSAIRISLGWASQQTDLDRLLEVWTAFIKRTRRRKAS